MVKRRVKKRKNKYAPLSGSFLMTSMIGFVISALIIPKYSVTWAFGFGTIFVIMFVASMISMEKAPIEPQLRRIR